MTEFVLTPQQYAIEEIIVERERQTGAAASNGVDVAIQDQINTPNDWVAYITAYAGRAADCWRNNREGQEFRRNMVKVGALALAALEADSNV